MRRSQVFERLRAEESGAAMMIAVILSAVVATLSVMMLSVGAHTDSSTARGRHWTQALHVAESGVEEAIARIQEANGDVATGTTFTGTAMEGPETGTYEVTITRATRNRYTIEAVGGIREGRRLGAVRNLRVELAPPPSFKHALFSFTTVETKNNDIIEGDIWGNQNVILADGTSVSGSATAATGYIRLENGASVAGDAWSGGFDANSSVRHAIRVKGSARIDGNAKASVTAPPDPVTCGGAANADFKIRLDNQAVIGGDVQTWGSVEGGTVLGNVNNASCSAAPPTLPMPTFTYAPENYDPATLHEFGTAAAPSSSAVNDFHAYLTANARRISGVFFINQTSPVSQANRVDLTNVVLTGDTAIVTNTPIYTNGTTDETSDAVVVLNSTYKPPVGTSCDVNEDTTECSVHVKNNFSVSGNTAVLVYAPFGPVAVKNNAIQYGAVYADSIQVKNNQTMTYDARVERVVGFGDVTLEVTQWEEVPAN